MEVSLRETNSKDIKKIFEWRNDPKVRDNSFNSDEIKWEDHSKNPNFAN